MNEPTRPAEDVRAYVEFGGATVPAADVVELTSEPATDLELIRDQLAKAAAAPTLTGRAMHLAIAAGIGLAIATYTEQDNDDPMTYTPIEDLRAARSSRGIR